MDEAMAIHPDGTPVNPEALRDAMRTGNVGGTSWMDDEKMVGLAAGDDIEAFTDYMQTVNYERMFNEDGSARDIQAWRQSVRDDEFYSKLLKENAASFHKVIISGTDDEVQDVLRVGQLEAQRKGEL